MAGGARVVVLRAPGKSLGNRAETSSRVVWILGRLVMLVIVMGAMGEEVGATVEVDGRLRDVMENGFFVYLRDGTNLRFKKSVTFFPSFPRSI